MTHRSISTVVFAAGLSLMAGVALADEPGPGGSKPMKPVTGEQVYKMVCQSCHMADGKGATGAGTMPALASNPRLASPAYPIVMIMKGRGAMPWFNGTLSNAQVAGVVTYIRTNFGNNYPKPVTEAEVAKLSGPPPVEQH